MENNNEKVQSSEIEEISIDEIEQVLGGASITSLAALRLPLETRPIVRVPLRGITAGNVAWQ